MPQRRNIAHIRPQSNYNTIMNIDSCPSHNVALNSELRDKDFAKTKRNQTFESSPIIHEDTLPLTSAVNLSRVHGKPQISDPYLPVKCSSKTTSGKTKSYRQLADSMLQQYTLMTYSSGPLLNSTYQNYSVTMPYQMHYSSYPLNASHGTNSNAHQDRNSQSAYCQGQSFPSFFNPRTAQNMPHGEKVNNWIESIPVFEVDEESWKSECYDSNFPLDWEEEEFDAPLLAESNRISFATHDELLFLQAKKFETAIRRLYRLEKEPNVPQTDFLVDSESFSDYM
ncbi:PFS1 (YHR185C) [Zygosaccharomyces parabailii]|nr:PFS1 (YHR185C) [Zygosaccharomyces parabailii]CDH10757.1 uncharacterized protein ZBAI_02543 [Zygosaccharomyces bailii ISA1307]